MSIKHFLLLTITLSLLALPSCTKDKEATRHSAPQESDTGLTITIDNTWDSDTTIFLNP